LAFNGSTIPSWSDIQQLTGPGILRGPQDFPNEAQERTFLSGHWLSSMTGMDHLQGGTRIQEHVMKDDGATASNNLPGAERSTNDPQVMAQLNAEWRLTEDSMAPNLIVRSLNEGGGDLRRRFMQYKSEDAKQKRRLATSYCNKFEQDWFAPPNVTTQEGTTGATDPSPFWKYVNEYGATATFAGIYDATDARYPKSNGLPNGFTTIDGINPANDPWYRVWQIPYNLSDGAEITLSTANSGGSDWIKAWVHAIGLIKYGALPWRPGESTTNNPVGNTDYICPVSTMGNALAHAHAGTNNNYLRSERGDPYFPSLSFAGIPLVACSLMDVAKVYPTSGTTAPTVGAGVTESAADIAGPRYPILSRKHLQWVMHSTFNFYMWPTRTPARQWDTEISPISTLHNRLCTSRRKMAMIFPATDVTGYGG
jgi:hypothetical protein